MTWESLTQDLAGLNRVIDESPILAFYYSLFWREGPAARSVLLARRF